MLHCTHAALPHLLRAAEDGPRRVADIVNISSTAGRTASSGTGVYNATKWAVNAFSESLRQEVTKRHVRVALIEPGAVTTELVEENRPEVQTMKRQRLGDGERLAAEDIADAIRFVVTLPRHIAANEMLVCRPNRNAKSHCCRYVLTSGPSCLRCASRSPRRTMTGASTIDAAR